MKKVLIHQPYKYGDYINLIPMAQKLVKLGYEVYFPYAYPVEDLIEYLSDIHFFKIGPEDVAASANFCRMNECILVNTQFPAPQYQPFRTENGGYLFNEECKYFIAEDILRCGLLYEDKYSITWHRNEEKEKALIAKLGIDLNEPYDICHLVRDSSARGELPFKQRKTIELSKVPGFSLLDWYPIMLSAQRILTVQSSVQCFVDCIKHHLKHKEIYLLNDPTEPDSLTVPAYGWKFDYFLKKRLT